jgi:DNA repair exonuclease SbcCD ATPase subunit
VTDSPPDPEFSAEVESALDGLYREHPDGFVAGRNELAKTLSAEGEREAAARVRALRRPSAAAWLINRISADDPDRVEGLTAAADELADAQRRVLEDGEDPAVLRAAAAQERERIEDMVGEARRVAGAAGAPVNESVIDRVANTLRAAGSDRELRGRLLRGRLDKERSAATVAGFETLSVAKPAPKRSEKRKEVERARKELAQLRERLGAAEARRDERQRTAEDAERELRQAKADLADSRREVRELSRELTKAERRSPG